jgi:DNA-binding LytR/AlgR family response regulator
MVLQQLVHPIPSTSGSIDSEGTPVAHSISSACAGKSAAEAEYREPLQTAKRARTGAAGAFSQVEFPGGQHALRIAVKAKGKILFMEMAEIMAVHAERNYASLKYRASTYLLRESLCSIAAKLKPHGFVQIHRSVLVNASVVDEVWPLSTGEYRLRIRNGKEYVVTRKYKDNLKQLANVWLGPSAFLSEGP